MGCSSSISAGEPTVINTSQQSGKEDGSPSQYINLVKQPDSPGGKDKRVPSIPINQSSGISNKEEQPFDTVENSPINRKQITPCPTINENRSSGTTYTETLDTRDSSKNEDLPPSYDSVVTENQKPETTLIETTDRQAEQKVEQPTSNSTSMTKILSDLENVLRKKYGFVGNIQSTVYSLNTEEAFQQLIEELNKSPATHKALDAVPAKEKTCPKIKDIAFVYWYGYGWFTAKIEDWLPDELSYMVRWTDGNWAPEKAKYTNLCVDKVPDPSTIGKGTKVLFKQGLYYCGYDDDGSICDSTGKSLTEAKKKEIADLGQVSDRWHMGQITRVYTDENCATIYDGEHVGNDDPQCTRGNYMDYCISFKGLKIDQLRTLPNIFNALDSNQMENGEEEECDIFVSKVTEDNTSVKTILQQIVSKYSISASDDEDSPENLQKTVGNIKVCKVYLVCLSDNFISSQQAMSELLYAKKTLGKPIIPLVIGASSKWSETTAGMLLAGQLYIHFKGTDSYNEKLSELKNNLEKLIISDSLNYKKEKANENKIITEQPKIFLSYCWSNSKTAFDAGQVRNYTGHSFCDPRKIKIDMEARIGQKIWLDIEQLDSVDDSGMFGQIAQGLSASSIVIICMSKEYANSQNCQMEANFALRSLNKEAIVVEVGSGTSDDKKAWVESSIGLVLPRDNHIDMTPDVINDANTYEKKLDEICEQLKIIPETKSDKNEDDNKDESGLRDTVPMKGDSVIAFYAAWQFFPAKIVSFDKNSMKYTVDWDDPDPSCRVQPYNLVAVNRTPNENEIGVGTNVLFKQGVYAFGDSTGDVWNLGIITQINEIDGALKYSGKHSKTEADGLAVASWPSYRPTFESLLCQDLRLFPNAIAMIEAYKNV